jgi:CRISPR/Cas system-associated exonuclease Cas4 (RecB family)
MKITWSKIPFILLLIPVMVYAERRAEYIEHKTIEKSFDVSSKALLEIDNKYGNVDIITWDQNRIDIEVKITVEGKDRDDVQDKLDDIEIDFIGKKDFVSAKTIFEKESWSFFKIFNNKSFQIEIDYTVKMPEKNRLRVDNDYGDIYLTELWGKADINCDYGRIVLGDLHAEDNEINLDYCSSSSISYIKSGHIDIDYTNLTVEKSENLYLQADYCTFRLDDASSFDFNCDYGKLSISHIDQLKGDGDYLVMRFGEIRRSLDLSCDYGSLRIDEIMPDFDFVRINSEYTGVKLGVHPDANFKIKADLSYCSLKNTHGFTFNREIIDNTSKFYQGYFGNPEANSSLYIESDFGSVNFIRN